MFYLLCVSFCVFPFVLFLLCFYFRVFTFLTFFFTIQSFIFKLSFLSILCPVPFLHTWLLSPLPFHLFPFTFSLSHLPFFPFHLSLSPFPFSFSFLIFLSHLLFLLYVSPFPFFLPFLLTFPYFIFSFFNHSFNSFSLSSNLIFPLIHFPFHQTSSTSAFVFCYPHTHHFKSL